jgi:transposase-like protein
MQPQPSAFFRKTLLDPANPQPRVINVDKNRAYPAAVEELKVEGNTPAPLSTTPMQIVVEQDHRVSKKRVWLARGYQSFSTAWRTSQGIEAVLSVAKCCSHAKSTSYVDACLDVKTER